MVSTQPKEGRAQDFFRKLERQLVLFDGAPHPFATLLYFALLEAMAAARFPRTSNRERFAQLLRSFADWPDADRVSLQQIQASDRSRKCPALKAEVDRRLDGWERGALIRQGPEIDPLAGELATVAEGTPKEAGAAADLIDRCRYVSLLWKLRNFTVHEARDPGPMFPLDEQPPAPYYSLWGLTEPRYRLTFPGVLVRHLTRRCATHLEKRFIAEGRDPYDSFPDTVSWID